MSMATCKICDAQSSHFVQAQLLGKYDVDHFKYAQCRLVRTEDPYWLVEADQTPITKSDDGLVARNIGFAQLTIEVITKFLRCMWSLP